MGVYYMFANFTDEEIIDGWSAKDGEWRYNYFDMAVITNYLLDKKDKIIDCKFISDESGEWDTYKDFKDVTAEVMFGMYEKGFFNEDNEDRWKGYLNYIYGKFKEAGMIDEFLEICKNNKFFNDFKKEKMVDNLK